MMKHQELFIIVFMISIPVFLLKYKEIQQKIPVIMWICVTVPQGVLACICKNPGTHRAKCHHRRRSGIHFDQVTVQETFSQADANRVSSGFGGVGFCWFPSVK